MISKHSNFKYEGSIPYFVGDRLYGQDMIRNFYSTLSYIGESVKGIAGLETFLLSGGLVTEGSTKSLIDISALTGIVLSQVEVPDSFSTIPPTKTTVDISIPISSDSLSDVSMSGATLDGSTVNYVKVGYTVVDGNTRSRAKKAGTYSYEVQPSISITINSIAPTSYELKLAHLVGNGTSTLTITPTTYSYSLGTILADNISEKTASAGVIIDSVLLRDGKIDTGNGATEVYDMNQDLKDTDSPTFANATISGHNIDSELDTLNSRVNQGVKDTDSPTFANATISGHNIDSELDTLNSRVNQGVKDTDSPTFASINTGNGATEVYDMNQDLKDTDSPTFATLSLESGDVIDINLKGATWQSNATKGDAYDIASVQFGLTDGVEKTVIGWHYTGSVYTGIGKIKRVGTLISIYDNADVLIESFNSPNATIVDGFVRMLAI